MFRRPAGYLASASSRGVAFLALFGALAAAHEGRAQQSFATGQSISPAYEGWVQNEDGSFDLVFGYMNRNWEQVVAVPVGPDNVIEPGGPDQGQPTRFQPRRNRFVFSIRVPADFGDRELVWTPHRERPDPTRLRDAQARLLHRRPGDTGELRGRPAPPARPPSSPRTPPPC